MQQQHKGILGIAISLSLLTGGGLTQGIQAQTAMPFRDVSTNSWSASAIERLNQKNILVGFQDQTFHPNASITRGEFATLLVKGLNISRPATTVPFRDTRGHWANIQVQQVVAAGYMTGFPDGTFRPNQPITRAEAMTTLVKATQQMGRPGTVATLTETQANQILSRYQDGNQVPEWADIPVAEATEEGLLLGEPGSQTMLRPNQSITRAEAASMLVNSRVEIGLDGPLPGRQTALLPVSEGPTTPPPLRGETEVRVPTVNVTFQEAIDPGKVAPGEFFHVITNSPIMVNNTLYPTGTLLTGQVIAVQRPNGSSPGQVQMVFTGLMSPTGEMVAFARPEDVQSTMAFSEAMQGTNGNVGTRLLRAPFQLGGGLIEAVGTTTGSVIQEVGMTTGGVLRNVGGALVNFVTLHPGEGFRQTGQALIGPFQGLGRVAQTVTTGGSNMVTLTGQEVTYLVDPSGRPVQKIAKGQTVPITFVQTNVSQPSPSIPCPR